MEFDSLVQKIREGKEDATELEGVSYKTVTGSDDKGTLPEGIDAYTERLRVKVAREGALGHAFFNGKHFEIDHDVRPPMFLLFSRDTDIFDRPTSSWEVCKQK
jgi:hypothetical protein